MNSKMVFEIMNYFNKILVVLGLVISINILHAATKTDAEIMPETLFGRLTYQKPELFGDLKYWFYQEVDQYQALNARLTPQETRQVGIFLAQSRGYHPFEVIPDPSEEIIQQALREALLNPPATYRMSCSEHEIQGTLFEKIADEYSNFDPNALNALRFLIANGVCRDRPDIVLKTLFQSYPLRRYSFERLYLLTNYAHFLDLDLNQATNEAGLSPLLAAAKGREDRAFNLACTQKFLGFDHRARSASGYSYYEQLEEDLKRSIDSVPVLMRPNNLSSLTLLMQLSGI